MKGSQNLYSNYLNLPLKNKLSQVLRKLVRRTVGCACINNVEYPSEENYLGASLVA